MVLKRWNLTLEQTEMNEVVEGMFNDALKSKLIASQQLEVKILTVPLRKNLRHKKTRAPIERRHHGRER